MDVPWGLWLMDADGKNPHSTVGGIVEPSSLAWSLIFSVLGWALGETILTLVGHVRRFEPLIGAALVLLMVIGFVVVQRRHVADRTARVLDPDPGP